MQARSGFNIQERMQSLQSEISDIYEELDRIDVSTHFAKVNKLKESLNDKLHELQFYIASDSDNRASS